MKVRTIEKDGFSWEVASTEKEGHPVFLLHGNSSSAQSFDGLCQSSLSNQFQFHAVNLPGHGNSTLPESFDLSIPALAGPVANVIKSLAGNEGFSVIGHSIGGHIVNHGAALLSGCKALITLSAPPVSLDTLPTAFREDPCNAAIFRSELSDEDIDLMARCLLGSASDTGNYLATLKQSIAGTNPGFREKLGMSLGQGKLENEQSIVDASAIPCALIYGEEDLFIQSEFCENISFSNALNKGTYGISGAGHSPHLSHADTVHAILEDVLTA